MKRSNLAFLIFFFLILCLSSCSQISELAGLGQPYQMQHSLAYYGVPDFSSPASATEWISQHASYSYSSYWKTPEQTLSSGYGDCKDYGLLLAYIAYTAWGAHAELVVIQIPGSVLYHALVKIDGIYYDPLGGGNGSEVPAGDTIIEVLSYDLAIFEATRIHSFLL